MRDYLQSTYQSRQLLALDVNGENVALPMAGVASGTEVEALYGWGRDRFTTGTFTVGTGRGGSRIEDKILSGRGTASLFAGQYTNPGNAAAMAAYGDRSISALSQEFLGNRHVRAYEPALVDSGRRMVGLGKGQLTGGALGGFVKPGHDLGSYSHTKITLARRGNAEIAMVSTANTSDSSYDKQVNTYRVYTDKARVSELKQVMGWIAEGKAQPKQTPLGAKPADGDLKHFWVSAPGEGDVGLKLAAEIKRRAGQEMWVISANLSHPSVVKALGDAAEAGSKVHVGINKENDHSSWDGHWAAPVMNALGVGRNPEKTQKGAAELLAMRSKNVEIVEFQNNLKDGYRHNNDLTTADGFVYHGSMRLNSALMNHGEGGVVDIAYHGTDKEMSNVIKGQFKASDTRKREYKVVANKRDMYNVGLQGKPAGLENFMPSRVNGGSIRYRIDPAAAIGATDYAINHERYLANEASKGDPVADAMLKLHRDQMQAYHQSSGMLTALHTMLVAEHPTEGQPLGATPAALLYFDQAMKAPTLGQSGWWPSMWGGDWGTEMGGGTQLGNRGAVDSMMLRGIRRFFRDVDPSGEEHGVTKSVEGVWSLGSSVIQNTAMFHFMGLPLLKMTAEFRKNAYANFERLGTNQGMRASGSRTVIKAWDRATVASLGFGLDAIENVVKPLAPFFGENVTEFAEKMHVIYSAPGTNVAKANVEVFQAADLTLQRVGLESISTKGMGGVFEHVLSPWNVVKSISTLAALPGALLRDAREVRQVTSFQQTLAAAADTEARVAEYQRHGMWSVAGKSEFDVRNAFSRDIFEDAQRILDRLTVDIDVARRSGNVEKAAALEVELGNQRTAAENAVKNAQAGAVNNLMRRVTGDHSMGVLKSFGNIWRDGINLALGSDTESLAGISKMQHLTRRFGYLGVAALAVGNFVSAHIGSASRATLADQWAAMSAMEAENQRLGGANFPLTMQYQAGFGRAGDWLYETAEARPFSMGVVGAGVGSMLGVAAGAMVSVLSRRGAGIAAGVGAVAGAAGSKYLLGAVGHTAEALSYGVQLAAAPIANAYQWWKVENFGNGPRTQHMGAAGYAHALNMQMAGDIARGGLHVESGNAEMAAYLYESAVSGLGPNRKTINGREIKAYALQWAPGGGYLGAVTGSMNELGDKTTFALTLQGPVMVQAGLSLTMPFGQHLRRDPMSPDGTSWEWGYMPNSSFEALAATAFTLKGIETAGSWAAAGAGALNRWAGGPSVSSEFMRTPLGVFSQFSKFVSTLAMVPAYIGGVAAARTRDILTKARLRRAGVGSEYAGEVNAALRHHLADDRAHELERVLDRIKSSTGDVVDDLRGRVDGRTASPQQVRDYNAALRTNNAITDDLVHQVTGAKGPWTSNWQPWTKAALDHADGLRDPNTSSAALDRFDRSGFARWRAADRFVGPVAALAVFGAPLAAFAAGEANTTSFAKGLSEWATTPGSGVSGFLAKPFRFAAQMGLAFYGLGGTTHALQNSLAAEEADAYPGQMGAKAGAKADNSWWGISVVAFTGRLQRAWKVAYLGGDSAFFGTGGVGVTIDPITMDTSKFSRAYMQTPFLLGLQFSVSGGIAGGKDNEQLSTWYNMSNFQSGTMNPLMVLRDKIREHKKPAAIGQMFHEASGLSELSQSGKREMTRRRNMTAWVLNNNNGVDAMLYFFGDKRFGGVNLKQMLPTGVSDFLFYKKGADALDYGNAFYNDFDWTRNGDSFEVEGGYGDANKTWAAPKGMSAYDLTQNDRSWTVRAAGIAASVAGLGVYAAFNYAFVANRWHPSATSLIPDQGPETKWGRLRSVAKTVGRAMGRDLTSALGGGAEQSYHMATWEVRPSGAVNGSYILREGGQARSPVSVVSIGKKFYTFGEGGMHAHDLVTNDGLKPWIQANTDQAFMKAATELSWTGDLATGQRIIGDAAASEAAGQHLTGTKDNSLQGLIRTRVANANLVTSEIEAMKLATSRAAAAANVRITRLSAGDLTDDVNKQLAKLQDHVGLLEARVHALDAVALHLEQSVKKTAEGLEIISRAVQSFSEAHPAGSFSSNINDLNTHFQPGEAALDALHLELERAGLAGIRGTNKAKLSIAGLVTDLGSTQAMAMQDLLAGNAKLDMGNGRGTTTLIHGLGWRRHDFAGGTFKLMGGAYAVGTNTLSSLTGAFVGSVLRDSDLAKEYKAYREQRVRSILGDVVGQMAADTPVYSDFDSAIAALSGQVNSNQTPTVNGRQAVANALNNMHGVLDAEALKKAKVDDIVAQTMQFLRDEASDGTGTLKMEQIDEFHKLITGSVREQLGAELRGSSAYLGRATLAAVGKTLVGSALQGGMTALMAPPAIMSGFQSFSGVYGLGIVGDRENFSEDYRRGAASIYTHSTAEQNTAAAMSVAGLAGSLLPSVAKLPAGTLRSIGARSVVGTGLAMLGTGIFMKATGASWKAAAVGSVTAGSAVGTGLGIALGFSSSLFAGTAAAAAGASGLAVVGAMAAPLVLGLGLAALAGFAMHASGANDRYSKFAESADDDIFSWLDKSPVAAGVMKTVTGAYDLLDTPARKMSEYAASVYAKPETRRGWLESAAAATANFVSPFLSSFDKNKPVYNLYSPMLAPATSVSSNPGFWTGSAMMGEAPQSAYFMSRMTPFWYGSYRDGVYTAITDQERMRTGNAQEMVGAWFGSESINGQRQDFAGSHIVDATSQYGSFMSSSFGNLSTLSLESSHLQLSIRATASQTYMSQLLNRQAVWGNLAQYATTEDSGYGNDLGKYTEAYVKSGKLVMGWSGMRQTDGAGSGVGYLGVGGYQRGTVVAGAGGVMNTGGFWGKHTVSSEYGVRVHPITGKTKMHWGMDVAAPMGASIPAPMAGVVEYAANAGGYGRRLVIRHNDGTKTAYNHLKDFSLRAGDAVTAGQILGHVGSSGMSTGAHLHFEVMNAKGELVDPRATYNNIVAHPQAPQPAPAGGTSPYRDMAARAAARHNVPLSLVMGVMGQESSGNPNARSNVGASGLMQLMPGTARGLGVTDIYDPEQNINAGVKYLAANYKVYKNWRLALAAYNGGPKANVMSTDKGHEHQRVWQNPKNWANPNLSKPQGASYGQTAHYVDIISRRLWNQGIDIDSLGLDIDQVAPTASTTPKPLHRPSPLATPKPSALPSSRPSALSVPTPLLTASPTPHPTPTPMARPSVMPTHRPVATPTPWSGSSGSSGWDPLPTPHPVATPTARPSLTPSPQHTATPAAGWTGLDFIRPTPTPMAIPHKAQATTRPAPKPSPKPSMLLLRATPAPRVDEHLQSLRPQALDMGHGVVLPAAGDLGREVRTLVIHHTESAGSTTVADVDRWHKSKGWDGIGYHFLVGADGEVHVGRPLSKVGAHAYQHNEDTIGIALAGSFTKHKLGAAQAAGLTRLLGGLAAQYGIDPRSSVVGHIHLNQTACPGENVLAILPQLKQEIAYHKAAVTQAFNGSPGVGPTRAAEAKLTMKMGEPGTPELPSATSPYLTPIALKPQRKRKAQEVKAAAARKGKRVVKAVITIEPGHDHVHSNTSRYRKAKPARKDIEVSVDPQQQSMMVNATYPDGEPWTSMYSRYQEPVEMLGTSRYAKAG